MIGYRRILEQKFRDGAEATTYAKDAGWTYLGQSGLVSKSHTYSGCTISWTSSERREVHDLRFRHADNGSAELFIASTTGILSTSRLPENVWPSLDVYEHIQRVVEGVNQEALSRGFKLQCWGHGDYRVSTIADGATKETFRDPTQAHKWIQSQAV